MAFDTELNKSSVHGWTIVPLFECAPSISIWLDGAITAEEFNLAQAAVGDLATALGRHIKEPEA